MISNCQNLLHQTKQKQLNTCLQTTINKNSSSTLDSKVYSQPSMSKMTTAVAADTASKKSLIEPPMEVVVVNSIIYSKPSFCSISVDLNDVPTDKKLLTKTKFTNGISPNNIKSFKETICPSSMDLKNSDFTFKAASCLAGLAASTSLDVDEDAKLYRMSTTINGSIHHQISDLCDNIFAMSGFFGATNNENDDDSFIEFAYNDDGDDDDDDEDDDENEDDFVEDDYDYEVDDDDDDNDVVDFSYECPIEPVSKLNCDSKKKVRFNTKPTVHVMHTWRFAYRAARKGEWEMYARDRERFKLRIQRTALALNPVLEREHRQKIYEKRFAHLYNDDDDDDDGHKKVSIELQKSKETSTNIESKKPHQKKKRRKRRFCKMGNKHYF